MSALELGDYLLLNPLALGFLLVLPWLAWRQRESAQPALGSVVATLLEHAPTRSLLHPPAKRRLPLGLTLLGLGAAILALSRPAQRVALPEEKAGIELLLCLDRSSSMRLHDEAQAPDRLSAAKSAAVQFLRGRQSDRIGLVGFARYPDLISPPTHDHRALEQLLIALEPVPADGPEDATGIGNAVARAATILSSSSARSRVIILLTDGEENVASAQTEKEIGPARAAVLARELGVRVYSIAVGRGRQLPSGEWQALDTRAIANLARQTGGAFFAANAASTIGDVFAAIDALEVTTFAQPRYRLEERYIPWLVSACVLLLVGQLLAHGRQQVVA